MDVASNLRKARRRAGLTQHTLARRAGTSQATISSYENGRKQPSVETFSRLLAATGSRMAIRARERPVILPSQRQHARAARGLAEVLALAEALPTRHQRRLRYPRLGAPQDRPA
jgi:transcriptional regulator with XRE-family HTH domain